MNWGLASMIALAVAYVIAVTVMEIWYARHRRALLRVWEARIKELWEQRGEVERCQLDLEEEVAMYQRLNSELRALTLAKTINLEELAKENAA